LVLWLIPGLSAIDGCGPPDTASADTPEARLAPIDQPSLGCQVPYGFVAGAPPAFPAMPERVIAYRVSVPARLDVFGLYLAFFIALCGEDDALHVVRTRYYLTGPLRGRFQRPAVYQPLGAGPSRGAPRGARPFF
jgi:hypothetical protein